MEFLLALGYNFILCIYIVQLNWIIPKLYYYMTVLIYYRCGIVYYNWPRATFAHNDIVSVIKS